MLLSLSQPDFQAAEGVVFARFSIGSDEFQRRFKVRFGESPSRLAIPAYDVVKLVLEAAGRVETEPKKLKRELLSLKPSKGTNGMVQFSSEGERLGEQVELMVIRRGAPHPVESEVSP